MRSTGAGLSYLELLSVSWLIAWRYFVLTMIFSWTGAPVLGLGIVGILATLQLPHQAVLSIAQALTFIAPFLLFYPLVVQMALAKEFRNFEIQAAVREDGSPDALTFVESLRPGLYFALLTFLIGLPVGLVAGIVIEAAGDPLWYANAVAVPWSLLVAQPIAIRMMLKKRFRSFQFGVTRANQTAPMADASAPMPVIDTTTGE